MPNLFITKDEMRRKENAQLLFSEKLDVKLLPENLIDC